MNGIECIIASEQLNDAFIIKIQKGMGNLGDRKVNGELDEAPPFGNKVELMNERRRRWKMA